VAQQIIQSYEKSLVATDQQKGVPLVGASAETEAAELSRRTENRFLFDHMYDRLESKLGEGILDVSQSTSLEDHATIFASPLIRVRGRAEIEDYAQMAVFMDKFNSIGEAIAYAGTLSDEIKQGVENLRKDIQEIKDRNQRAKAQQALKKQLDPKHLAKEKGLHQDEKHLANLKMFAELFYPGGFDVTINMEHNGRNYGFRGVVDRRWLRVRPEMIRALYGNYTASDWTIVGQVTHIPGAIPPEPDETPLATEHDADQNPSMRDPFRGMFRATRLFERMFLESKSRTDLIISPLAIYRESGSRQ
jgi:hypothetical protein